MRNSFYIVSDIAYPLGMHLEDLFSPNINELTAHQIFSSRSMSEVRVVAEWIFNDTENYFSFLDLKKKNGLKCYFVNLYYLFSYKKCSYMFVSEQKFKAF